MDNYRKMSHTKWQCKYHVIFIPKYRRKQLYGVVKKGLREVFHELASHRGSEIEEDHIMPDHLHMLIWIPPKYAVSSVIGYIKGKSAIHVARDYMGRGQNYAGYRLWARGYFVDSVGRDSEVIRKYIRDQEIKDKRQDELDFGGNQEP